MRVDADGIERESAERAICDRCCVVGWRGDWPDQGGIVADASGDLLCDACADEEAEHLREIPVWVRGTLDDC